MAGLLADSGAANAGNVGDAAALTFQTDPGPTSGVRSFRANKRPQEFGNFAATRSLPILPEVLRDLLHGNRAIFAEPLQDQFHQARESDFVRALQLFVQPVGELEKAL